MRAILIIDCGGRGAELTAKRVRELGVWSVVERDVSESRIRELEPAGIIVVGGEDGVLPNPSVLSLGIPVLGIGCRLGARKASVPVSRSELRADRSSALFNGLGRLIVTAERALEAPPEGFRTTAFFADGPVAAFEDAVRRIYGVQFHPAAYPSESGTDVLSNFVIRVCNADTGWSPDAYLRARVAEIRRRVGDARVFLPVTGDAASGVCAVLLSKILPGRVYCAAADTGILSDPDTESALSDLLSFGLRVSAADAEESAMSGLSGLTDRAEKLAAVRHASLQALARAASEIPGPLLLGRSSLYPEEDAQSQGLTELYGFSDVISPLDGLFREEALRLGLILGMPRSFLRRQRLAPGAAARIIGEVNYEKAAMLRAADRIFRDEVERGRVRPARYFAVLTDMRVTRGAVVVLRAVDAEGSVSPYSRLPHRVLERASARIKSEVPGIGRVLYDITDTPAEPDW
ncbi:MAG: hypothetical protein GXY20_07545 [Clostridiales bacterium]|nr:hypothetical protein [Clostridiales bacterium]